ncbi:MAG: radical SAM protein [archaeon]|nr:MAG: radical SAM protein [archaeon]
MTDYPLTFKCNNNCITCISKTSEISKISDPRIQDIKNAIEKINPRTDYLGLGGGEPTLRKEFFEILKYARKTNPNIYIFLTTNGRIFSYKEFAKKLSKLSLKNFRVGVALYGHNEKIHERITRCRGSFGQTVKGIKNLIEFGFHVEIRVIISRLNYKSLPHIAKFAAEKFPGMERFVFVNMKYTGNALKNRKKVLVKISKVVPLTERAVKILKENNVNTKLYHFPLCILPENLRNMAKGVTKEAGELTFVKVCEKCRLREDCPRIWKSYVKLVGDKEFGFVG